MSSTKKILWIAGASALLAIVILLGGTLHFYLYITSPASETPQPVAVRISRGASFRSIVSGLAKKGIITHPWYFNALAALEHERGGVKAGEYLLDTGMTPLKVMDMITSGKVAQASLTVPEGFTMREIGDRIEALGLGSSTQFLKAARDAGRLRKFGIPSDSFEGYLFPETYRFSRGTSEADILAAMAVQFIKKVKTEEILRAVSASGFTLHEVITLASLIEKETALHREKPLVSAVFYNRLRKKIFNDSDTTEIYTMKNFNGNIRKKDLNIDSPYNTYRYPGLPPGPIANPGLDSILAALHPASDKFLYFVSRQDGSHHFSLSLREHNRAVRKYQLRKRSS